MVNNSDELLIGIMVFIRLNLLREVAVFFDRTAYFLEWDQVIAKTMFNYFPIAFC